MDPTNVEVFSYIEGRYVYREIQVKIGWQRSLQCLLWLCIRLLIEAVEAAKEYSASVWEGYCGLQEY